MDFNLLVDLLAEIRSRIDLLSSQIVFEITLRRQIDGFDDIVIDELEPGDADCRQLQCHLPADGADVDQDAIVGTMALNAAAMGGSSQGNRDPQAYQRTAEILIAHGANVNGRVDRQKTPLDDAVEYNNEHVAAVLRRHGAQVSDSSD
jgi:ankyrin repeat protein